ncbi:MAG TPA: hypothetical protein DCL60_08290 [Armatimonadetes bacterium]|nr:hypothetical protein [Armatimonadota bacterium]
MHVSGTPPAFVLSWDQTLRLRPNFVIRAGCSAHHLRQKPDYQSAFVIGISPVFCTTKPLYLLFWAQ